MPTKVLNTGYVPRSHQLEVHLKRKRFSVVVAHRRFGKTVMAVNQLIHDALICPLPRPQFAYIAPFYRQAKAVAWSYLKEFTSCFAGDRDVNETELRVTLPGQREVRLYGADNPDALRGIYLDGVVLDEPAQMSPRAWSEVIRPALTDRGGSALFIGTPMGHNDFYDLYQWARQVPNERGEVAGPDWAAFMFRASETGIIPQHELEEARRTMGRDQYDQEFETSFEAAIKGAYFGEEMRAAHEAGRITTLPHDPSLPVGTAWDLGKRDATAIWFFQLHGGAVRLIDYYENRGEQIAHYAGVLLDKAKPPFNYRYRNDWHFAPHDIEVKELFGTMRSRLDVARSLGIPFITVPRIADKRDSIHAARMMLPRCWFDEKRCAIGIEHLRQYRTQWDAERKVFAPQPLHDEHSDGADAFQTLAMANPAGYSATSTGGSLPPAHEDF